MGGLGGRGEGGYLIATLEALVSSMRLINVFFAVCFYRKALDNNGLNEV